MNSRRILAAIAAAGVVATVLGIAVSPPALTEAAWTTANFSRGSLTAGTVRPPGTLTCSGGGANLLGPPPNTTFTWVAPATPAGSAPIVDYAWTLTRTGVTISSTTTGTSAVIAGGAANTGTYTFTVVARSHGSWVSVPGPTGTFVKQDGVLNILAATASCSVP